MSARFAWIGRILRGRRLDRNPLRRGSDRAETVVLVALLAVFAGGSPFAAHASASWISTLSQHELRGQHANFRQITAVLLDPPWTPAGYGIGLAPQADARWVAPDGAVRTGLITVPAGAKAGAGVKIWTDLSGQHVTPLQQDQIAMRADLAAMAAVATLGVVLVIAAGTARLVLNRRRMAGWDADWLATGLRGGSRPDR